MQTTLLNFTNQDLFDASRAFFAKIGVKCTDQSRLPLNFLSVYEKSVKKLGLAVPQALADVFAKIETTHVIGAVTEDSLAGNVAATSLEEIEAAEQHYKGMLLMAVKVKDGVALTRTEMTQVTRGANRIATHNPVTVFILQTGKLSIATCERTQFVQSWRPGEKLGKVSILKDVNCSHPHRGHLDILLSLDVSSCKTYDDLYAHWKDVFSAKLLTKQFYREIQNWYFWALKADQHVSFPNALDDDTDDEKFNKENLIRLITRLVFTWFMKAKGLVNEDLFKPDFLASALKHFDPEGAMDDPSAKDADKRCTYYRAILQNLFFATFNQEIPDRGFVKSIYVKGEPKSDQYQIKNYYRNAKLFAETDEAKIIAYFNGSPFVNGGLFECLDNVEQFDKQSGKTRVYSWDGFSNNVRFKDGSLKSALIPDRLFFGAEQVVDLSEFFEKDKASKAVKVRGIVNILNDYVFTIEENTPLDEDVALDPELLGKVFENLLGCYNPETQQMARNATGSFYTPREIVNYMVRVSLAAYLKRTCPKIVPAEIDALVEGRVELESMPSVKEGAQEILMALFKAKILDPACGSGAFPMGTLAAIVEILRTLDPDNKHWFKIVLEESLKEAESVADVGDEKERAELKAQIEYDFQKRVDFPDYARKLYVIEHCIFGSDIQPIAVQISRLRFFITLLCEQAKTDDPVKNYGITPLPNLENNFVAANSLLSIDLKDMRELLGQKTIVKLVKQLRAKRHQLFLPKTSDKKKRLQKEDEDLRTKIATAAESLYDENVAEKLKLLEAEIIRADAELKKLTPDDFKDVVRDIEETDLFGNTTVTQKKVVGTGNALKKRREAMADEIATLKNSSRKERLLADLKRLVAWNPFSFNVAETFLDPEWMFGVKCGFDIIIANPPYGKILPDDVVKAVGIEFPAFNDTKDAFVAFVFKALSLVSVNGVLEFIIPSSWHGGPKYLSLREECLKNQIVHVVELPFDMFCSAYVDTGIVGVIKAQPHEDWTTCVCRYRGREEFDVSNLKEFDEIRQCDWQAVYDKKFILSLEQLNIEKRLQDLGRCLNDVIVAKRGVLLDKSYIKTAHDDVCNFPYFVGDVYRYTVNEKKQWIDFNCEFKEGPKQVEWYSEPRLLLRSLMSRGHRLMASYTSDTFVTNKNLYILRAANETVDLRFVLALVNSTLYSHLYSSRVSGSVKDDFPQVTLSDLLSLPLPNFGDQDVQTLSLLVDRILSAKKDDPQTDTSTLEAEIDSIVYKLYGLTDDEIAVVEKAVKK